MSWLGLSYPQGRLAERYAQVQSFGTCGRQLALTGRCEAATLYVAQLPHVRLVEQAAAQMPCFAGWAGSPQAAELNFTREHEPFS